MRHLYSTLAEVHRLSTVVQDGAAVLSWRQVEAMVDSALGVPGQLLCRLDLMLTRPGKDVPPPVTAGRAPDRVGVLFCSPTPELHAGDQVRCLKGPVVGTFEVRSIPDVALAFSDGHHLEVPIVEVAQSLDVGPRVFLPEDESH